MAYSIQCFQNFSWSEVQLVKDDPVTLLHGLDKNAFLEDKRQGRDIRRGRGRRGRGSVGAQVGLEVGVLVVVDAMADLTYTTRQVGYERGLAHRGLAL